MRALPPGEDEPVYSLLSPENSETRAELFTGGLFARGRLFLPVLARLLNQADASLLGRVPAPGYFPLEKLRGCRVLARMLVPRGEFFGSDGTPRTHKNGAKDRPCPTGWRHKGVSHNPSSPLIGDGNCG